MQRRRKMMSSHDKKGKEGLKRKKFQAHLLLPSLVFNTLKLIVIFSVYLSTHFYQLITFLSILNDCCEIFF